jgi:hypothetical protein
MRNKYLNKIYNAPEKETELATAKDKQDRKRPYKDEKAGRRIPTFFNGEPRKHTPDRQY